MLASHFRSGISRALILGLLSLVATEALVAPESAAPGTDSQFPFVTIEHFVPVHTQAMRQGAFSSQHRSTSVAHPFFLIGSDTDSLAWLESNRERLIQLGAFGLVVEVPDIAAYRQLMKTADGLIVRPVSGDLIARHLGLDVYPALITANGFFQSDLP